MQQATKSLKKQTFFKNTSFLLALQVANFILPFLLIPYLTRTLGTTLFGIVSFGIAMAQVACIITDYGFSLSATYSIAKNQNNKHYINKVLSAVYLCKAILLLIVMLLFSIYLLVENKYQEYELFLFLMTLTVVGQTFLPVWFFQGIEKMGYITGYTISSRLIYFFLIIYFVSSPNDYYMVAVANGFSYIFAAILGLIVIIKLDYRFVWPGWKFTKATFARSTDFFWSRAAVATYTSSGAFFLGLVSTPLQVAYYSAAEQIYRGGQALLNPITQALYPHMTKNKNTEFFFKILKLAVVGSLIGVTIGITIGPWTIELLFGNGFEESYMILVVFLIVFLITTPSVLLGYPFLGALGYTNLANRSVIYAGLVQILLLGVCFFMDLKQGIFISLTVLFVECMVLLLRIRWATKCYRAYFSK